MTEATFRRAVLAGYPDRVAQRREPGSPNLRLASGTGAVLGRESGVHDGEFLVAIDVQAGVDRRSGANQAWVRMASLVERDWLRSNRSDVEHRLDTQGIVRAVAVDRYDALVLAERPTGVDAAMAAVMLLDAWRQRGPSESDVRFIRRLRFAGHATDVDRLAERAAHRVRGVDDIQLARECSADLLHALDREAPNTLVVPSGRAVPLEYGDDGGVSAAVKLQELFGLAETPRIGSKREPVVLSLLAPNGRPVQVTRDLRSFWDRTYPEVRKELRGRYPRHPWPDDPWNATPTARTRPRPVRR